MSRRAAAVLFFLSFLSVAGCTNETPREVVLVARGMTFILPSDPATPNPVIPLRAGERVTITLRNEAPGLVHNFEIPAWNVTTELIRAGETTTVTFDVPGPPGRVEYTCRPHSELMRGFIEVTPS